MRRMTRRELVAGAVAPALISCGRPRTRDKSSVTVLYGESENVFTPDEDEPVKFLVFMPLVAWNRRGELEGRLAQSWKPSRDFRTWAIHLREGIRWHDGVPVTAHDLKFTLDLLKSPELLGFAPSSYTVDALDDQTCQIAYERQYLWDEGALSDYIACWPKHLLEKRDPKQINTWDFWKRPVGCGPYRHLRTVPGTMMEFEANPDYFRGKPRIAKVILKFGGTNAVPELLSSAVDAVCGPQRADVLNLSHNRSFRTHQHPIGGGLAVWWNLRHPLFEDAVARRALTHAINRRELLQVLNLPEDARPIDFVRTDPQVRRGDFPESMPYDLELAGRLLDQAGWTKRPGKRVRERNGVPFRFQALIQGTPGDATSAVYVQDQLKKIGVQMEIRPIYWVKPRIKSGEFEAAILGLGSWDLESFLRATGYDNPSFFDLLTKAKEVFDPYEKDRMQGELADIFQADIPLTFLHPTATTTIASARIKGMDTSPYRGDITWCMDELWLEEVA